MNIRRVLWIAPFEAVAALTVLTVIMSLGALLSGCQLSSAPGGGTGVDGLAGIVVDGRGAPVAGARVRLHAAPASDLSKIGFSDSTLTDDKGRYRFSKLRRGLYNLQASARVRDTVFAFFRPDLAPKGQMDEGADTLRLTGSLSAKVLDSLGAPLAGVLCRIAGSGWSAISDTAGTCLFIDVAPGAYRVTATWEKTRDVSAPVTVASGASSDAGEMRLEALPENVPAGWTQISALDYAFYVPPELEIASEEYMPEENGSTALWKAVHQSSGMTLTIRLSNMGAPPEPQSPYQEFSQKTLWSEGGSQAILFSARIPDKDEAPRGRYVASLLISGNLIQIPHLRLGYFHVEAHTREERARAVRLLETIRLWNGPGAIPLSKPAPPVLATPGPGDSITSDSTLRWVNTQPTDISRYLVQVASDTASAPAREEIITPDPAAKVRLLRFTSDSSLGLPSGRYFWRVIAVGRGGSNASAWRSFALEGLKTLNVLGLKFQGRFDWRLTDTVPTVAEGALRTRTFTSGSGTLRVILDTNGTLPDLRGMPNYAAREIPWNDSKRATLTRYTQPEAGGTRYVSRLQPWRMAGLDSLGEESWQFFQEPWIEAVASTPEGWAEHQEMLAAAREGGGGGSSFRPRTLVAPENGATNVALPVKVSWVHVPTQDPAYSFRVQVFEDGPIAKLVVNDSVSRNNPLEGGGTRHAWTVPGLQPGKTYHWRVLAATQTATGEMLPDPRFWSISELRSFTTAK